MRHGLVLALIVGVRITRIIAVQLTVGAVHSIIVPVEQAAQVGLAPDQVKIREEYGGGFPANVEGLHQLHCLVGVLNMVDVGEEVFADTAHRIWSVNRCSTIMIITTVEVKGLFRIMTTYCKSMSVSLPLHHYTTHGRSHISMSTSTAAISWPLKHRENAGVAWVSPSRPFAKWCIIQS